MKLLSTPIEGLWVAHMQEIDDHRGAFARWFCEQALHPAIGERRIVQVNHSRTTSVGAVRGMHFQHSPHTEMKMVRCIRGRVWDVTVDLRSGSSTFLRWHAQELTPENGCMMLIPEGCAHGFQVLQAESELLYLHTAFYVPDAEGGVRHDDPRLAISWPVPVTDLSARDGGHPLLPHDFSGLNV